MFLLSFLLNSLVIIGIVSIMPKPIQIDTIYNIILEFIKNKLNVDIIVIMDPTFFNLFSAYLFNNFGIISNWKLIINDPTINNVIPISAGPILNWCLINKGMFNKIIAKP